MTLFYNECYDCDTSSSDDASIALWSIGNDDEACKDLLHCVMLEENINADDQSNDAALLHNANDTKEPCLNAMITLWLLFILTMTQMH